MEHYERRRAQIRIYYALKELGYTFFGYKEDRSKLMEDYFDPESWDGVATHPNHPGVVVCIGVGPYEAKSRSGRDEVKNEFDPGETCHKCQGSGRWPGGLTLTEARLDPAKQHYLEYLQESSKGSVRMGMPHVVSPLNYHDDGSPKCGYCAGRGHKLVTRQVVLYTWPTFQANPKGRNWHVEKDGKVILSGVGLAKCAGYYSGPDVNADAAVTKLVDQIHAAVVRGERASDAPRTAGAAESVDAGGVKFEVNHERDWTWVRFPGGKPPETVREALKATFGARFSGKRVAWYITRPVSVEDLQATFGARV
ncbi:MAG: hypothetical protein KJ077_10735 [Anaerolineae bacterium]|nr:hypothetical protein [Anaerolineae bacterium]